MSAQGTQSPPLEATSRVDPMGNVNVGGTKAQGVKDIDQRVGKQQNLQRRVGRGCKRIEHFAFMTHRSIR
jgi:hypothetical protein